ncbi:hypothetical protein Emed_002503 [Eimeria media]
MKDSSSSNSNSSTNVHSSINSGSSSGPPTTTRGASPYENLHESLTSLALAIISSAGLQCGFTMPHHPGCSNTSSSSSRCNDSSSSSSSRCSKSKAFQHS